MLAPCPVLLLRRSDRCSRCCFSARMAVSRTRRSRASSTLGTMGGSFCATHASRTLPTSPLHRLPYVTPYADSLRKLVSARYRDEMTAFPCERGAFVCARAVLLHEIAVIECGGAAQLLA